MLQFCVLLQFLVYNIIFILNLILKFIDFLFFVNKKIYKQNIDNDLEKSNKLRLDNYLEFKNLNIKINSNNIYTILRQKFYNTQK